MDAEPTMSEQRRRLMEIAGDGTPLEVWHAADLLLAAAEASLAALQTEYDQREAVWSKDLNNYYRASQERAEELSASLAASEERVRRLKEILGQIANHGQHTTAGKLINLAKRALSSEATP